MAIRLRHLRHRMLDGLGRGRLRKLKRKLAQFGALVNRQTFTVANLTDIFTVTSHGFNAFVDGPVVVSNEGGALPTGLEGGKLYWTGEIDANTFYLHPTAADAAADTNRVNVTDDGTGTHTISRP